MNASSVELNTRPAWSEESELVWRKWWTSTPKDELVATTIGPPVGEFLSDAAARFLALAEAHRGVGFVSPNPLVGCVIRNSDNRFLNAGAHLKVGQNHAEINALEGLVESDLQQAKVTVTLEPCSHHGKTPPCALALSKLPLATVDILRIDPFPLVNGMGTELLKSKGIQVQISDSMSDLASELVDVFIHNIETRSVFTALKIATSADHVFALQNSARYWITGKRSVEYGHFLRQKYDSILVGHKTAIIDNPTLDVRSAKFNGRLPTRIVLFSAEAKIDWILKSNLAQDGRGPVLLVWPESLLKHSGQLSLPEHIEIVGAKSDENGHVEWQTLKWLFWDLGLRSVLVEGGAGIWKSALAQDAVQKIHWFRSNAILAGMSKALKFEFPHGKMNEASVSFQLHGDDYLEKSLMSQ